MGISAMQWVFLFARQDAGRCPLWVCSGESQPSILINVIRSCTDRDTNSFLKWSLRQSVFKWQGSASFLRTSNRNGLAVSCSLAVHSE